MSSNVPITKRKRTSKKTKKSWRKNCDISDVETFLQDQRVQEATGGLVANKADDQLFYLDTKTTLNSGRRQPKPLKCHAALVPDPMIPPARTCHSERKEKVKSSKPDTLKRKAQVDPVKQSKKKPLFDLWGGHNINQTDETLDDHFVNICKKKRITPPSYHGDKPSELPAVEIPVAGASYKPTVKDHQELLKQAIAVEKKKIQEEQRLKRALDDQFPLASEAPNETTWLQEWESSGLFDNDDDEDAKDEAKQQADDDNEESGVIKLSNNPPVRRENKKTEKERRKLKEIRKMERDTERKKKSRVRENGTMRLKTIKKEVMRHEMKLAARQARKQLEKEQTKGVITRKLGKVKYEEPNIELKLTEELPSSLRLLKPEGNLMSDRFKSLQKRNIIEPRQRAKVVCKYKPKAFEKKSHKLVS